MMGQQWREEGVWKLPRNRHCMKSFPQAQVVPGFHQHSLAQLVLHSDRWQNRQPDTFTRQKAHHGDVVNFSCKRGDDVEAAGGLD